MKNFYRVIIGTELLNGRRKDAHFDFLLDELKKRNWSLKASFIVPDDVKLMREIFTLIRDDANSVLFSFGGIGATPDDYTRQVAADIFGDGILYTNEKACELIKSQFKNDAYPHRIKMADIPKNANLLTNVINQVPGFSLENRFFFVPGFPQMARHMILEALEIIGKNEAQTYSSNFMVFASENDIIDIMQELPSTISLSSLPKIPLNDEKSAEILLSSENELELKKWYDFFISNLNKKQIKFKEIQ